MNNCGYDPGTLIACPNTNVNMQRCILDFAHSRKATTTALSLRHEATWDADSATSHTQIFPQRLPNAAAKARFAEAQYVADAPHSHLVFPPDVGRRGDPRRLKPRLFLKRQFA